MRVRLEIQGMNWNYETVEDDHWNADDLEHERGAAAKALGVVVSQARMVLGLPVEEGN